MKIIDILGAFVSGLIVISAFSLIVAPKSNLANVVNAFGDAGSKLLDSAKALPTGSY